MKCERCGKVYCYYSKTKYPCPHCGFNGVKEIKMEMLTTHTVIKLCPSVEESPKYGDETKLIRMDNILIIKGGMESGKSSVDIQCTDKDGNKYLIFTTGALLKMIASAIHE